jgi:hypothetical protein
MSDVERPTPLGLPLTRPRVVEPHATATRAL